MSPSPANPRPNRPVANSARSDGARLPGRGDEAASSADGGLLIFVGRSGARGQHGDAARIREARQLFAPPQGTASHGSSRIVKCGWDIGSGAESVASLE